MLYKTTEDPDVRQALTAAGEPRFRWVVNPAEDMFARLCVTTPNLVDAYLTAGYEEGSNRGQTLARASRLRAEPRIEERVQHYAAVQQARMDIREDRIMAELAAVALSDPLDFYADDGTPLPLRQIPAHARAAIRDISITGRQTVDPEGNVTTKTISQYKLVDKIKALDMLTRIKGMAADPQQIQRPVVVIDMSRGPTSDPEVINAEQPPLLDDLLG
jgi:hypothetical protein